MTGKAQDLIRETAVTSLAYLLAFVVTFEILTPIQVVFFPAFLSHASLLFLPHGVRVLAAWLLGWRSVLALLPGVLAVFVYLAGWGVLAPSRLAAIAIAVTVPAAVFALCRRLGWDLSPTRQGRACWACIMGAGLLISIVTSLLTNLVLGSPPKDYIAYLIGDFFGLFFLLLLLMFLFRYLRRHQG